MQLTQKRFVVLLAAIFLIALACRLALTHQFVGLGAPPDANANSDQIDYELLTVHLLTGQGYAVTPGTPTASRTPGTSLTLAPAYALFGRSFAMGRIWFCLLSAATCVLVAWLGSLIGNRVIGLLAGLGLALYPGHAYNAMHFVSETPFGFWFVLAMIFTVLAMRRDKAGWRMDVLAGACWAMAVYTRPNLLLAVPIAGVLAGIAFLLRDRRHLMRFTVQVAVLSLVLSPWVMRNAVVMGQPTISTITGYGLWGSHNELTFSDPAHRGGWVKASALIDDEHPLTGDEVQRNSQATHYGVEAIKSHADEMPGLVAAKLWRLTTPFTSTDNQIARWSFAISWIVVAPAMLIGIVTLLWRKRARACVLMLPLLATVASTVVFYGSVRFRDAIAPTLIVFAAVGVERIISMLRGTSSIDVTPAGELSSDQVTARAA